MSIKVLRKINEARKEIKRSNLKKAGWNDFSNYAYYTPEQVDLLVNNVCDKFGLMHCFDMPRDEHGIYGKMTIYDIESGEEKVFVMATDIPSITATNICQQLGGAMTFTNRYMLQDIFNIVDNNLDFDTQKPQNQSNPAAQNKKGGKRNINKWLGDKDLDAILKLDDIQRIKDGIKYWTSEDRGMSNANKGKIENRIAELTDFPQCIQES